MTTLSDLRQMHAQSAHAGLTSAAFGGDDQQARQAVEDESEQEQHQAEFDQRTAGTDRRWLR